jgi:hypothetical protein
VENLTTKKPKKQQLGHLYYVPVAASLGADVGCIVLKIQKRG